VGTVHLWQTKTGFMIKYLFCKIVIGILKFILMKKILLPVFFVCPFLSTAQKIDLDPFSITVKYRSLPKIKIDNTYRTYNVVVEGTKLMSPFLKDMLPEQTVTLEGWRKLPANGHLSIKVNLDNLIPEAVSVKERSEVIKSRNGQITSTRTYYYQEVKYSFAATALVNDYKGAHILDLDLANRENKYVYNSPEFALKPLAEGYFLINSLKITASLYRQCVNNAMHYLSETITEDFGFREVSSNDIMWIIDSRKHPEYAAHRQAFQQLSDVLFGINASSNMEKVREQLKPVIEYFEDIKKNYSGTSKHDRKIRYASYYNLAVLYYYLDDPQMMMKEARGLLLNDYDSKDAVGFEQTATWLKNLFESTNIYTRHFSIDDASFKGPYEKDAAATQLSGLK
jgi:hypothetical protein